MTMESSPNRSLIHILTIDDDPNITGYVEDIFRCQQGFSLAIASDAGEAVKRLQEATPDLILLDVNLPDVDGFKFITFLKENEAWKNIPVVFLTGEVSWAKRTQGLERGAADYLAKPFAPEVLVERIRHLMIPLKTQS